MAALLLLEDTLNIYCNIYRLKSNSHFRAIYILYKLYSMSSGPNMHGLATTDC